MVRHKSNSGCNRSVAVSQVYSITASYVYIYIYILIFGVSKRVTLKNKRKYALKLQNKIAKIKKIKTR